MNTETDLVERRVGMTLGGKWKLERLLGVGGMAAVYVGVHKIGRRDAIKILHPELAANKEIARRFEQEAQAVNLFHHPGAVGILDIDVTEDGAPFMVMELLEGESVETRIERQLMDVPETLRVADEMLDVLAAAHATGIVHRDIKPDNLFLCKDGSLKVLDFGIARVRQGAPKTSYTRAGMTIGTLTYMPPEQVAGKEIDARADIFAVGCTLFRMLTGRSPHEGNTELELMVKMAMEPAPPLASVAAALPADLCMVVDRALAFDKEKRYPDAATMQRDVRALRAGAPPPYAAALVAAGDLPNPIKAPSVEVSRVSGGPTGQFAIPVQAPPSAARASLPTSMPIPVSMMMPAMVAPDAPAPPTPGERVPTLSGEAPISMGRGSLASLSHQPSTPAMPPVSLKQPQQQQNKKEKVIAAAAILGTLLLLGIAVTIWWGRRSATGDGAEAADPSSSDAPAAQARPARGEDPSGEDGEGDSPANSTASTATPRSAGNNPAGNPGPRQPQQQLPQLPPGYYYPGSNGLPPGYGYQPDFAGPGKGHGKKHK